MGYVILGVSIGFNLVGRWQQALAAVSSRSWGQARAAGGLDAFPGQQVCCFVGVFWILWILARLELRGSGRSDGVAGGCYGHI